MMAAAANRLSALPDDVLQSILSFAPPKRGTSNRRPLATVASGVARGASAVTLDCTLYSAARTSSYPETFLRDAAKVLDAFRGTELKRLMVLLHMWAYQVERQK